MDKMGLERRQARVAEETKVKQGLDWRRQWAFLSFSLIVVRTGTMILPDVYDEKHGRTETGCQKKSKQICMTPDARIWL